MRHLLLNRITTLLAAAMAGLVFTGPSLLLTPANAASLAARPARAAGHAHAAKGWQRINKWMQINTATRNVVLTVIAAENSTNNAFNFDGYAKGKADFHVPLGWKVKIDFSNHAPVVPHSLAIASSHGNNPTLPKIDGKHIQISDPTHGITGKTKKTLTFTAKPVGKYFLICEVPGHDAFGMWDRFTISATFRRPALQVH